MENRPWLTVLFQGIIEPQAACRELHYEFLHGRFLPKELGAWKIDLNYHRIAVTFSIFEPQPDLNDALERLRNTGLKIVATLLQAQALFSSQILKLSGYTVSFQVLDNAIEPLWVELDVTGPTLHKIVSISNLEVATQIVAGTAFFTGHENLQRALRNYETALEYEGKNRLIYLWQAVEEILWAYYHPKPEKGVPTSPPYASAANALQLNRTSKNPTEWLSELGTLCHEYARHSDARPVKHTLPGTLSDCTEAARLRVIELIKRYAMDLGQKHAWEELPEDLLTGWLDHEPEFIHRSISPSV
jgi:hypothetical protein